jgi:hypothetical protein
MRHPPSGGLLGCGFEESLQVFLFLLGLAAIDFDSLPGKPRERLQQ